MPTAQLARKLNRFDAAMIVVSGIIGVGIFNNASPIAKLVETPFLILGVWLAGGVIALAGAFVFAELSTVVPQVGGQYAYFREAFGPLAGFLHGWSLLFIIQSGATAAVAVACGEYAVRTFGLAPAATTPIALALLVGLIAFHALGIKPGSVLINILTVGKTIAIAGLVVGAFVLVRKTGIVLQPATPPGVGSGTLVSLFFAGLVQAMFTYGGWQNSCFVVEEIRDPEKNLPQAILLGVVIVILVYMGANIAYVHVLGAPALAATKTPAIDAADVIFGSWGGQLVGILIIVSTFGFLNLALMTAPRVYFAMARDGLFFKAAARVSSRTHAPVVAIVTQGALAAAFAVTNTYERLVGFAVFADWIFFALAGVSLLVFRRTKREAPRPFPAPLYPFVPLLFIAAGVGIVVNLYVADPQTALVGSAVLLLGIPVFLLWRRLR